MLQIETIVACTDFSDSAEEAIEQALAWGRRFEATVHLLHVVTAPERFPKAVGVVLSQYKEEAFGDLESQASSMLGDLLEGHPPGEATVETHVRRGEAVAPAALAFADEEANLVVVGAHGRRGARELVTGSTSAEITRGAACPVLVARPGAPSLETAGSGARILVPVDFSEHSRRAVHCGRALSARYEAPLDLVYVAPPPASPGALDPAMGMMEPEGGAAQARTQEVRAAATERLEDLIEASGPDVQEAEAHVLEGHPPSALVEFAEAQGTGLIVMASHGRTGLKRLLIGSVAERVVRQASCPVFVAKSFETSVRSGSEAEAS
jgi:nucleotide-binding universal stress UspA family protein